MRPPDEVKARTGWDGAGGTSREALLAELHRHIPPALLLPDHRLQALLQQAVLWQASVCADAPPGLAAGGVGGAGAGAALLQDFAFARDRLPAAPSRRDARAPLR